MPRAERTAAVENDLAELAVCHSLVQLGVEQRGRVGVVGRSCGRGHRGGNRGTGCLCISSRCPGRRGLGVAGAQPQRGHGNECSERTLHGYHSNDVKNLPCPRGCQTKPHASVKLFAPLAPR